MAATPQCDFSLGTPFSSLLPSHVLGPLKGTGGPQEIL